MDIDCIKPGQQLIYVKSYPGRANESERYWATVAAVHKSRVRIQFMKGGAVTQVMVSPDYLDAPKTRAAAG